MRGGELVACELVVIRERGDRLVYIAHPSGQPSAKFLSGTVARDIVVFEHSAHDFPQRIGYRRQGPSLQAWIEGTRDGQARRVEFSYRRRPAPATDSRSRRPAGLQAPVPLARLPGTDYLCWTTTRSRFARPTLTGPTATGGLSVLECQPKEPSHDDESRARACTL